jgi:hypothetical protein
MQNRKSKQEELKTFLNSQIPKAKSMQGQRRFKMMYLNRIADALGVNSYEVVLSDLTDQQCDLVRREVLAWKR